MSRQAAKGTGEAAEETRSLEQVFSWNILGTSLLLEERSMKKILAIAAVAALSAGVSA